MALTSTERQSFIKALAGMLYHAVSDGYADYRKMVFGRTLKVDKPADDGAAGTATTETGVFRFEEDVQITGIYFVPSAAVTAHGTNFATLLVDKRDGAGGAATNLATFATDTVTTDDMAAFVPKALPLTATTADLILSAGNVLTIEITKGGTGVVIPRGSWIVNYEER